MLRRDSPPCGGSTYTNVSAWGSWMGCKRASRSCVSAKRAGRCERCRAQVLAGAGESGRGMSCEGRGTVCCGWLCIGAELVREGSRASGPGAGGRGTGWALGNLSTWAVITDRKSPGTKESRSWGKLFPSTYRQPTTSLCLSIFFFPPEAPLRRGGVGRSGRWAKNLDGSL